MSLRICLLSILIFTFTFLFCTETGYKEKTAFKNNEIDSALIKFENFIYKDGTHGGVLRFPLYKEPKSFNPFVEPQSVPFMYEGLVSLYGKEIRNCLANRIEISEDSTVWRFKLRENIFWSDSTIITTDDVLFTYNDALKNCNKINVFFDLVNENSPLRPYSVTVDKNNGIVFKFEKFSNSKLELFTIPILPKEKYASMAKESFCDSLSVNVSMDCMVGSGPFIINEYAPFGRVVFVKNKYYYRKDFKGQGLPYVDTLELVMHSDLEEALESFKNGSIDFLPADGVDLNKIKDFKKYNLYRQKASHNGNLLMINKSSSLYSILGKEGVDILSSIIPRKMIIDSLLNGDGVHDAPLFLWYGANKNIKSESISKILKKFEKIGIKKDKNGNLLNNKGEEISASIVVSAANGFRKQVAEIIADKFKKIGINVNVHKLGYEEYTAKINSSKWDMAIASYDEGNSLRSALTFWSEMAEDSENKKLLKKLSAEASSLSVEDTLFKRKTLTTIHTSNSAIFLVRSSRSILSSMRVANVNPSPFGGFTGDVSRLYITKKKDVENKK